MSTVHIVNGENAVVNVLTLWDKVEKWFASTEAKAVTEIKRDEEIILTTLKPILAAAESQVLSDLVVAIRSILVTLEDAGVKSLADLETLVLNSLQSVEPELLDVARNVGSNVLQAVIALVLARLKL